MAGEGDKPRVIVKKKKGGHGGGHHGGAWKVAYADFVTAMMALFMVLWLLTQADLQLRQQIAQYFRNPGVLAGAAFISDGGNEHRSREPQVVGSDVLVMQGKGEQDKKVDGEQPRSDEESAGQQEQKELEGQARAIEQAVKAIAEGSPELASLKDQVIIQVTAAGLSIQVIDKSQSAGLLFDLSSSELKPALVTLLRQIAVVLARLPNRVQVGGHTDSRPFPSNSTKTNWDLSFERANGARRVLEDGGLWHGQVNRVLAYADTEPLVPTDPLADENRRLSILAERASDDSGPDPIVLPSDAPPERS